MEFAGDFETHITVEPPASCLEALQSFAAAHGLKCAHILLARGTHPSQPMLTRRATGTLPAQRTAAADLARQLAEVGFQVIRVKIEVDIANQDVPVSAVEVLGQPHSRYFEHHVKLLLTADADLAPLAELAGRHGAHLSRNALRQRGDGMQERFITQRCYQMGRDQACATLEALLDAVASLRWHVLDVEAEYVVYDTNATVDAGWMRHLET